jgi:TolA-binding protein
MRKHEHFEELAALAAIGQLSVEEHGELLEHLRGCDGCKRSSDQFNFILDELPLPEPSASDRDLQQLQGASYRQRFLERASAEGVRFTPEARGEKKRWVATSFFRNWRPYALGVASAVAVMVVVSAVVLPKVLSRSAVSQVTASSSGPAVTTPARADAPASSDSSARMSDPASVTITDLQQASVDAQKRLDFLRRELARAQADYRQLLQDAERWKDQAGQLQSKNQENEQQLGQARSQVEKLSQDNDQLTAGLVAQQFRVTELSEEVENQKAAVERERQLTAAARDVRELMGARNLHIIDVADLDGQGKSKKSFGRVFYTEGKSLIFYAFDLSQKGSASKVSFQAWGQNQSASSNVKNLGVFHVDDQVQKRWVLRVDNPELLKSIESVFVTVEPSPGRDKPSGQKLLYAYLGTQANHP